MGFRLGRRTEGPESVDLVLRVLFLCLVGINESTESYCIGSRDHFVEADLREITVYCGSLLELSFNL